jgi:hypothetical protein
MKYSVLLALLGVSSIEAISLGSMTII